MLGLLVNSEEEIRIIGDKSLSNRDFKRVADPLRKFGVKFKLTNNKNLPLTILGNKNLKPIRYNQTKKYRAFIAAYVSGVRLIDNIKLY